MKKVTVFFIILFFVLGVVLYDFIAEDVVEKSIERNESNASLATENENLHHQVRFHKHSLFMHYMNQSSESVIREFGEPTRKDPTPYQYFSYVYTDGKTYQLQFGIDEKDTVVMIYVSGYEQLEEPLQVGMDYEQLNRRYKFLNNITLKTAKGWYQFELSEQDVLERPLIEVDEMFAQLYFDRWTKKLSSYRYISKETLLAQRPYTLSYRGDLLETKEPSREQWVEIEKGASEQILELTNIIRYRHGLLPLQKDERTADVAYFHSKDMAENVYFSHVSPTEGELADRLKKAKVAYSLAAENIAAHYTDAIAAVEGWLNSEGHRVNMLNDEFSHLGVGVFKKYYTQNFISKW